jgi:hypothetical protein
MEQPQEDRTRIERLEQMSLEHGERIKFLEDLMARVITMTEIVTQLLQRREEDTDTNGAA